MTQCRPFLQNEDEDDEEGAININKDDNDEEDECHPDYVPQHFPSFPHPTDFDVPCLDHLWDGQKEHYRNEKIIWSMRARTTNSMLL